MSIPHILSWPAAGAHDTWREGYRLGAIMATVIWLWVALVDGVSGQPFHTFSALGGVMIFTLMHYALNVTYGVVLLSAVHAADRSPSLVIALMFGLITFEGAIAMLTNIIAQASVGNVAWIGLFGGSLIGATVGAVLIARTHPLAEYLRRAEEER